MNNKKGQGFMNLGLLLLAAALLLTAYNFYDSYRAGKAAEKAFEEVSEELKLANTDEDRLFEKFPYLEMPEVEIEGRKYIATLEIPALGLNLPVQSELDNSALKVSPCRYKGSAYTDDMIIAGHNYKSHFGPIRDLYVGAEVKLTDMMNNEFRYVISGIEIIPTHSVAEMEEGEWDLTLFTCTRSGNERVTLRCTRQIGE